jgi:hypothetical protein
VDQAQGNKLLIELPAQYPLRFNDVFEKIWLACKPEERLGFLGKVVEALAEAPLSHFSKGGMEFVINNLTNFIALHPHPLETAVQLSARLHEIVDTEPRKSAVSVYERAATLEGYWGLKLQLAPQSDFSSLMDEGLPLCLEMLKLNTEAQHMSALSYAIADDAPTDLNLLVLYHAMTKADQNAALTVLQPWLESLAEEPKEQVLQSIEIRYGDQDLVLPKCIRFLQGDRMDANECPIRFTHLRKIEATGSLNLPWAEIRKRLPRLRPEKTP